MTKRSNEGDHSLRDECSYLSSHDWNNNQKKQCLHPRMATTIQNNMITQQQQRVRKIVPSPQGVTEAANLIMGEGNIVFIPTESVYMACTSIYLSKSSSSAQQETFQQLVNISSGSTTAAAAAAASESPPPQPIILLIPNAVSSLNCCLAFLWQKRPYALHSNIKEVEKNNTTKTVIIFSEAKEVLRRLMKKFCPSPLILYLRTSVNNNSNSMTTIEREQSNYVAISNPSHPLAKSVIRQASSSLLYNNDSEDEKKVIVGVPSLQQYHYDGNISYITKASDVSSSQFIPSEENSNTNLHVLNGEDKQEAFAVPTCRYGKPLCSSIWIDDNSRTLHIRGRHNDYNNNRHQEQGNDNNNNNTMDINELNILQAIRHSNSVPKDEKQKYRNRVICSVLFKWKVSDERTR